MIANEQIKKFVRALNKAGMTQAEAARRIGIGATHLNCVLHGRKKPSLELLEKMAAFSESLVCSA